MRGDQLLDPSIEIGDSAAEYIDQRDKAAGRHGTCL
jgi:hypothetical protein